MEDAKPEEVGVGELLIRDLLMDLERAEEAFKRKKITSVALENARVVGVDMVNGGKIVGCFADNPLRDGYFEILTRQGVVSRVAYDSVVAVHATETLTEVRRFDN